MSDKWITFDCYGTLVDWQTGFRQILHRAVGDRVDDLVGRYHTVEPEVQAEMPDATYKAPQELPSQARCRSSAAHTADDHDGNLDGTHRRVALLGVVETRAQRCRVSPLETRSGTFSRGMITRIALPDYLVR